MKSNQSPRQPESAPSSPASGLRDWLRLAEQQAAQAEALSTPESSMTYAQLGQAVRALAQRLRDAGVTPGERVALAATRSIDSIVAILACVEAGVGYVPLDLAYPVERLQAMLLDAAPRVVIGEPEAVQRLRDAVGTVPTLEAPAPPVPAPFAAEPDLVYVLFTSGSTGRPKGVAMGATPLHELIRWHATHPRLGQPARTLQFAPLSFDVHFQEIFSTLACRGTLVIVPEAQRRDPAGLHAALIGRQVERIFVPYVALQMVAEASREQVPPALRDVISAGEQLQVTPAIRALFQRLPGAELHNHYGPTETHVVTAHELRGDAAAWPQIPPIGAALPHVAIALRAEEGGALLPDGAGVGELLLGGHTLAHGYLGRPELTAERFLDVVPGLEGRWYATGDLVQRDEQGVCTYLGRADQQVKVDGFRIEPGEIELQLMAHEAVKDAVVSAPDLPGIGKQLVAYLVLRDPSADGAAVSAALRAALRKVLPEYMVPVRYEVLDRLPTTPSGKIDRRGLPLPRIDSLPPPTDPVALVRALWCELLGLPQIDPHHNLFDLGAKSLLVLRFVSRLKDAGIHRLSVADVYDRPTLAGLTSLLEGAASPAKARARAKAAHGGPGGTGGIAIVGMATRTAGATDVDGFWDNLMAGREGIRHFAPHELDASVPESMRSRPNFVAARGMLDDVARFDAGFFGISAREATVMDPQQRLMLELAWTALEHAAIDPSQADMRIGVYAGTANNTYVVALRAEQPSLVQQYSEFATMLASEKDYVATRVSHRLNLNGPAVSVHTACSTGLVAVTQAWQALASGQCDVALAGGATVVVPQEGGYLHVEGGMESADGHCRPFDASATGTVFASAGAVVVLKRLEDALQDGDTVYGVIRGVGLNNDGGDKASFTAPSVSGQAGAIRMALDHAQVSARSIGYVEAHGTGTSLGDPIEIAALTRAWREDTPDSGYCGIGSAKSNLGHTIAAAGVIGLIKATLALHREVIPATLHFQQPNPQIDFAATPFHVVARNTPWPRGSEPRRAAVSSFGVGGTNAHVIVEEAPVTAASHGDADADARAWLLPLSASTPQAALQRAADLAGYLESHPGVPLSAVAHTLMRGRKPMAHRVAVVATDAASASAALRKLKTAVNAWTKPRTVFLMPGQGSQHPGMARRLVDEVPAFREALEACLAVAEPLLGPNLRTWLLRADPRDAEAAEQLADTRYAQPALFSVSYALLAWLDTLGVKPDALIGHSIGEYAAACHAGVFSLHDAMNAVVARGQAMAAQPRGAMMAVRADADTVKALLPAGVEIAGANAPSLTVVAGPAEALAAFGSHLESRDIGVTRLKVSHAFHSASMDGALPKIEAALKPMALKAPHTPVYSCVSGEPLQAHEATDPAYWARQVRATVQFSRAVQAELAKGPAVFIEVGPGQALTALLRQHRTPDGQVPRIVPLLGPANDPGDAAVAALSGLGQAWCAGVQVAWPVAAHEPRAVLPTYPFGGERYWFTRRAPDVLPAPVGAAATPSSTATPEAPIIMSRLPRLEQELTRVLSDVSGLAAEELTRDATFVDQGLDSLSLTQATLELERVFGLKLRFRRLLEDLDTLGKLAQFLDAELPADKFAPAPAPMPAPAAAAQPAAVASTAVASVPVAAAPVSVAQPIFAPLGHAAPMGDNAPFMQQLVLQQMQLMSQQLAMLSGQPAALVPVPMAAPVPAVQAGTSAQAVPAPVAAAAQAAAGADAPAQPSIRSLIEKPFGAAARITLDNKQDFTPAQKRWLDDFVARYVQRSGSSKTFSQDNRKVMADPRVVTGFNPLWKDLVYPIVVNRSKGARMWDLDGNEYIDLLSAFGANLLGYQPDDVLSAMMEQLQAGIEVGPQHPLSAEVARLISEFTGMERVAFCNTGSEAVMGAMRIARTVTGRKTIAIFTNSYHGIFDEVIVRGTKQLRSLSAAPGILANAVENILVLDWNSEDSLRVLRERGSELAAIMTEPIQNKYPTVQPREFVKSLRQIADDAGCALIFDEVVTGFRVAPGGAQEFYGVRADIATYGKIIGGGLPFAAIGGASHWLDALDGGHWQYGDDSYPEAGVTYFAGTFVRHPLALAAAKASLLHLKRGGRALYATLNGRTQQLVDRLNSAFASRGAPVKAVHCASLWRLQWDDNQKFVSLFYYLARFHGLHLYEQFGHFVTEAMGDAEIDRIFTVFTQALDELMALGFILPRDGTPPPDGGPGKGSDRSARSEAGLTPGQTERWLAGSFDPNARRALNESFCVSLAGDVDVAALKAAFQQVLERHPAFRVRFDTFDTGQPRQTLAPPETWAMPINEVDLRAQPDAPAALDAFCTSASERDFPLEQAPLAAASLLYLADGRVVAHVVASHLVFDGWASSVFNAELAEAYRARVEGRAPQWKPAESPLDFAEAELARMNGPQGQESLRFWTELLRNPPPPLSLGDRVPPSPRRYSADTVRTELDGELFAAIRASARQSGATLFQWLLTAVSLVLQRRSAQPEFVVSIPYASQSLARHGPLMADGVLDLPLRLRCSADEPGQAVLARVRSQLMDALEYPLATQGTVARALGMRSAGDRPPFTGIYFNLNPRIDLSGFAPLAATMHEGRKRGTLSELFFNFYEKEDSLALDLHHSAEFFSPERATELVNDLRAVCAAMAAGLGAPVRELAGPARAVEAAPVAAAAPDARLLAWNSTAVALAPHSRIEQWVTRQATATPDAIAIEAKGVVLSYRALEARANRVAQVLASRGVGAGDLVGVCLSRGPDLMPALLGVLKTGAAYVPLDPGFPRERLQYMAEDAAVRLVITESHHADLSGVPRDKQLRVDDDSAVLEAAPDAPLPARADGLQDAPAYVIYTSGSTGKPKGVVLPQQAVCNFLASMRKQPGLAAGDRLLAVTTLSFDIAVLELFLPLTVGAKVVIAQREEAMDGEVLGAMVGRHHINVMQATPTTWHVLLDAGWRAPAGFRALCGGEPLPPSLAAKLLAQGIELWNMYGPTETTVWSTLARITDAAQKITIGRPIDNTQVWVLDEQMRPCAIGAEGELCIGGDGVALGYFKRPELTAERFVPDPFRTAPGARLYRTGDLARWRDDGTLEHLGRLDFQVKIRGYRIELGEIEARLEALPGVARSVVMAREDVPGDVRLVGYVVAQAGASLDAAQMREALRAGLPDYMLPQHIVTLETMPLLPNGKIDRKSLPAPSGPALITRSTGVPPRNATEQAVADAMASVLQLSGLSVGDDFFSLGGHSLLAARLIGQINRELGLHLGLRTLFESPTVEALAQAIERERGGGAIVRAPIEHRAQQSHAPLTLMQQRIQFIDQMRPGSVAYNAPSCHRLKGPMDLAAFDRAFGEVVRRQAALRTSIVKAADGGYEQRVLESAEVSLLPLQDLSGLAEAEREAVLSADVNALAEASFDLARGPLFKARLYRLGPDHHALFFMPHHIVWDGWSFDILYTEMSALYAAYAAGATSPLPELAVTYGDFAQWHNDWLHSDEIAGQLAYWKRTLADAPPVSATPTDLARAAGATGRGATEFMHVPLATADRLRELARRTGSTLSIVTLSVYAAMMSQWLNTPTPAIGLPVRGRPSPELESVMGFFNNMLPMRLSVSWSVSALDWIRTVRASVTEVFANQDVPFEMLAQMTPGSLYQVMFSFQDARARQTQWGPLDHERIPVMHKGATEDLNLWMVEIPSGIEAGVQYNADVFLPETARALRDRFLATLERLVDNPEQPVDVLLGASPADEEQLARWGRPAVEAQPGDDPLERLARHVAAAPQALAWRDERRELSRAEVMALVESTQSHLRNRLPAPLAAGRDVIAVRSADPLVRVVTALAVLGLGARCLVADTASAWSGRSDVVMVAGDAEVQGRSAGVVQVDTASAMPEGVRSASPAETLAAPRVPLDRTQLASLHAGLRVLAEVPEGSRVLNLAAVAGAEELVQASFALAAGAAWHDAACNTPADAERLLLQGTASDIRLTLATAPTWHALARAAQGRRLATAAVIDVRQSSPALLQALAAAGVDVVHVYRAPALGVSVAAGRAADVTGSALFGRPLLPGGVSVVDAQGRRVPAGVAGRLRCDGVDDTALPEVAEVRWRSDGVLQFLGVPDTASVDDVRVAGPVEPPATDTERALAAIWQGLLGRSPLSVTDSFFEVGGHSMLAMRLMVQIEEKFGRRLPLSALLESPTIRHMAHRLDTNEETDSLVLIREGNRALPPLFLVHDGEGEVLLYRNLANRLRGDRAVFGLQPLAGGGLVMRHTRIPDMAAYHVEKIRAQQPQGPYLIGGLCAGGVIAFEVARQLQAQGQQVDMVAILDIGDVQAPSNRTRTTRKRLERFRSVFRNDEGVSLANHLMTSVSKATKKVRNYLAYRQESQAERAEVDRLAAELRRSLDEGTEPPDETKALTVPQLYYFARADYQPAPGRFEGDVTLFRATHGDGTEGDTPCIELYTEPLFGWPARITGTVQAFDVDGGHSTMLQEPHVASLAVQLQACLDRLDGAAADASTHAEPGTSAARASQSDREVAAMG
ncbi:MAG: amino acid adenylation domain-containing protein [Rhizobacter sp.]|nr:amino acid adenylation domain-containing protein [Rhizobacter sp.]